MIILCACGAAYETSTIIRHGDIIKEVIYYYKYVMLFIFSRYGYLMKNRISI
jgi:hypothetical protein